MRKSGKIFVAAVSKAVEALEASALRAINNAAPSDKFGVRYIMGRTNLPKKNGKITCHIFPPSGEDELLKKIRENFLDEGFVVEEDKVYGEFFSKSLHIETEGPRFQVQA